MVRLMPSVWTIPICAVAAGTPPCQLLATDQLPLPLKVQLGSAATFVTGIAANAAAISHDFFPMRKCFLEVIFAPCLGSDRRVPRCRAGQSYPRRKRGVQGNQAIPPIFRRRIASNV